MPICFSLTMISLDLHSFFWTCKEGGLKGTFPIPILSSDVSKEMKLSHGCHLLFLPIENESVKH